jgi:murein DD-endopeptidase MepM/ murein hydrolase activator NlpD
MAFKVADYNELQSENRDLKVEKKNLEVSTRTLDTKIAALESLSQKLTTLIESDTWNKRFGRLNLAALGGSKLDYRTSEIVNRSSEIVGISKVQPNVEALKGRTSELENQLKRIEQVAERRATMIRFTPTIWPLKGRIASHYGNRLDPFTGDAEVHFGLDIVGLYGSIVRAPADGTVIYSSRKADYGNLVIIDHGHSLSTRFGHLSRFAVRNGQQVAKGDILGYVGTTGRSTAPHLHYEVRQNDRPVNPRNYLPKAE